MLFLANKILPDKGGTFESYQKKKCNYSGRLQGTQYLFPKNTLTSGTSGRGA
jgi:hypothetical protein